MGKTRIKKGDLVQVITRVRGRRNEDGTKTSDLGKQGKVLEVLGEQNRVIVEGVNRIKRHTKATQQGGTGGIITAEAPIHVSNVMLVDGGGVTRLGSKRVDVEKRRGDGSTYAAQRSVRISRKSGDEI